ncbi:sacsin N-terminal ATP-binding-like domain-containing protein [Frankia sp. Cas3]|uniref:sacsin N-terminal ATP-binding-like domain-containing protein n=2 Tax=unclassified Frankia TaxID=2632575 RepID=UPI002AD3D2CF|nr:molecular chaperone Hsp90 [Frankia sp. Cas3]
MDAQPYGNVIVDADSGDAQADPLDHPRRDDRHDQLAVGELNDPFGTAAIQRRVLDAWAASPARFREDANAEEDAARGAYRDRLVVELLQNAVDAAHAAAVPCRVLMTLTSSDDTATESHAGMLEIANTGAGLSAAGVESLSTLRASAKRDTAALGRFGVGFAAVLAVSDTPSIVSRRPMGPWEERDHHSGGVGWSKQATIDAINTLGVPALDAELTRRDGAVPVLRLPSTLADAPPPPEGYDTVVRLPLRDAGAMALARALLAGLDPTLPLVMPGLSEITVVVDGARTTLSCVWVDPTPAGPAGPAGQRARDNDLSGAPGGLNGHGQEVALLDGRRWVGRVRRGVIPPDLLIDRPVEERARTGYEARAMVCEGGWPSGVPTLVRAPQPTDEPLSLPVLVSVGLPLEPSRRHTVAGPLRDWLVDRLAETIVDLAVDLGAGSPPGPDAEPGVSALPGADTSSVAPAGPDLFALIAAGQDPGVTPAAQARDAFDLRALVGTGHPPAHSPLAALELVPTGLPAGEVDARLRDALARLLPEAPMFPGGHRGSDCVVCDLGPATDQVTALLTAPAVLRGLRPAGARSDDRRAPSGPLDDRPENDEFGTDELGTDKPDTDKPSDDADGAVDGLLPAAYAARHWRPALDVLGVDRLDTADVVEILSELRRPPSWWARAYAALATAPDRDALGALPVPLAASAPDRDPAPDAGTGPGPDDTRLGVRMVTGPRGLLLPTTDLDVLALVSSGLPLRVAHPDACAGAARDVLRTLGAVEGTPASVLRDGSVADAIADIDPEADPDAARALANAVLALARDAGDIAGELPWLADLLLPDTDGDFSPAGELLIEAGPLDRVLASDAPFSVLADDFARAWPVGVLEAVGVLRTFAVLHVTDVGLDPDEPVLLDLDDSDTWVEELTARLESAPDQARAGGEPSAPPTLTTFSAVRDLEFVDPSRWPGALAELARPPLRDVVMHSDRLRRPGSGGHARDADVSYTRWWLSRHALLPVAGSTTVLPPTELALPGADPLLDGLFAPAAPLPGVDVGLLRLLGCRLTLADVLSDPDAVLDLLDRLGDADRDVPWPAARLLYMAAVDAAAALPRAEVPDHDPARSIDPPLTVRTPNGVVRTSDAVIVDAPDLMPLLGAGRGALRMPLDRAAEASLVLGVPLLSSLGDCDVVSTPPSPTDTAPDGTPYLSHGRLLVADVDGEPTPVAWRVLGGIGGEIHVDASAGTNALARALAWHAGTWDRRHAIAEALREPAGDDQRQAEADLDDS